MKIANRRQCNLSFDVYVLSRNPKHTVILLQVSDSSTTTVFENIFIILDFL